MSEPATPASAVPAGPTANGPAHPPTDAALARAARILSGDVRPDDYLPITPEVRRLTDRELEYARSRYATVGITELEPEVERRQLRQNLLLVHCKHQHVAYIEDDTGIVVVITGLDEIGELLRKLPAELWSERIATDYPDDSIWLL